MHLPTKKYFTKKAKQNMFNGSKYDLKSQLSGILTEPLNPRGIVHTYNFMRSVET